MSVWLCCWPPSGVTPSMQALSGSPRRRRWRSQYRCLGGLWYLFLIRMWRRIGRKWTAWCLIRILRPSPRSLRAQMSPKQVPVTSPQDPVRPLVQGNALNNSRRDPGLRSSGAAGGSCDRKEPARHREAAQQRSTAQINRGPSGESLVWAVPYLSSGIMRRARRWAWVVQKPDDLPPRGGILMGLQSGLLASPPECKGKGGGTEAGRGGGGGRLEIRPPRG